jgi:ribosomal protein S18 acetylase RimI-like enzyme
MKEPNQPPEPIRASAPRRLSWLSYKRSANKDMLIIRSFRSEDETTIVDLWLRCGLVHPANDPRKDIFRKSKVRPDLFLVGTHGGNIVASVMVGYEGHRGWINYLAVDPDYQKRGFGRMMMEEAERVLRAEGCPKINLQVRTSNVDVLAFYRAIGFLQDDVVSFGKRLEHDQKEPNQSLVPTTTAVTSPAAQESRQPRSRHT